MLEARRLARCLPVLLATVIVAVPAAASADDSECSGAPRQSWIDKDAVRAMAVGMGYKVRRVSVDDGCYLVKGFDANGARIELKVDPATGTVVRHDEDRPTADDPPARELRLGHRVV